MDGRPTWTDCDEAGDYVVPNLLSPRDLVFRPDNMDETVPHTHIEEFHSAMNEDFQNQFKNAYDQDQDYIHGEAHKQLKTCFGFGLVIV